MFHGKSLRMNEEFNLALNNMNLILKCENGALDFMGRLDSVSMNCLK